MPWTPYAELDRLLAELVADVRAALGDNPCGAYLRGPFAIGDADEHSDVDFIVVTQHELSEGEQAAVHELHGRLCERDVEWAQHPEGSYVPAERLRRVDPARAPLFYLDNGARARRRPGRTCTDDARARRGRRDDAVRRPPCRPAVSGTAHVVPARSWILNSGRR